MKKLISRQRLIEESEGDGKDPACILVAPDDLCVINPADLADLNENPGDDSAEDTDD